MRMEGPTNTQAGESDILKLEKVPIIRGWDGKTCGKDWGTIGTGRKLAAVKQWIKKHKVPEDWKMQLGEKFVEDMLEREWALYIYPACNHQMVFLLI